MVDGQGNAVSLIQSIYHDFGSGIVPRGTGVLLQNRGSFFSLDPAHVNRLEPGKRTFHTLNPAMLLKDGKPFLVYGTMGGEGQPQTQAAIATRVLDYGMTRRKPSTRPAGCTAAPGASPATTSSWRAAYPLTWPTSWPGAGTPCAG